MKDMSGLTKLKYNSSLSSVVLSPASNFDWPNQYEDSEKEDIQDESEEDE